MPMREEQREDADGIVGLVESGDYQTAMILLAGLSRSGGFDAALDALRRIHEATPPGGR